MRYINENVKNLNRIFDQHDRTGFLRLDLNENPDGLPQEFINYVLKFVTPELLSKYPETNKFTELLANKLNLLTSNICLTNGSSEAIRYVIECFTSSKGKIVGVTPAYFMFQIYSEMYDRNYVKISYEDDLSININKIIEELTDDTQLLILMNPNNPMGNAYSESDFTKLIDIAKQKNIMVLIDEAYCEFSSKSCIDFLSKGNVLITRTFSKFYSLAGCRLGYVLGISDHIELIQKNCTPHNVNAFALLFAEKLLENEITVKTLKKEFEEGENYLLNFLKDNKYQYKHEHGNFIFIKPKKLNASEVVESMRKHKILIKEYKNIGNLGNCLRVTIGNVNSMKRFAKCFNKTQGI